MADYKYRDCEKCGHGQYGYGGEPCKHCGGLVAKLAAHEATIKELEGKLAESEKTVAKVVNDRATILGTASPRTKQAFFRMKAAEQKAAALAVRAKGTMNLFNKILIDYVRIKQGVEEARQRLSKFPHSSLRRRILGIILSCKPGLGLEQDIEEALSLPDDAAEVLARYDAAKATEKHE